MDEMETTDYRRPNDVVRIPILADIVSAERSKASFNLSQRSETILEDVLGYLSELPLADLSEEWVNEIWDTQFTECQEFYLERDAREIVKALDNITRSTRDWLELEHVELDRLQRSFHGGDQIIVNETTSELSAVFWTTLIDRGVRYKGLVALLFYFMHQGQQIGAGPVPRSLCLSSTSLYFILLSVPGSSAFNMFHPVLFAKAVETFKLALKLHLARLSPKKRKKARGGSSSQKQSQSQRPRCRHLSRASSTSSSQFPGDGNDSDESDVDDFDGLESESEIQKLTVGLNHVLGNFLSLLDHFSLKRSSESMEVAVQQLVDLTHLETQYPNLDFGHSIRRSNLSGLAHNSYVGLSKLCKPLHGSVDSAIKLVLKNLMPGILMNPSRGAADLTQRGLTVIREHTKHYVKHLIAEIGEASHEPVEILIEQMCLRVQDRAEWRHKTSEVILDLLDGLPAALNERFLRWILSLAFHERSSHRLFAVELLGRLLIKNEAEKRRIAPSLDVVVEEESEHDYGASPSRHRRQQIGSRQAENRSVITDTMHRFIFGVIFSRCRDVATSVRARALQTLADITTCPDVVHNIFRTFETIVGNELEFVAEVAPPVVTERNKKRIRETPDFLKLLQDSNSDLNGVDPIPSTDDFVDFLRRRALDDSANVRKNSLQVIENVLKFTSGTFDSTDLIEILTEHCRDPSLMVRKQIAASLTELVKNDPQHQFVIKKWVEGIFPLILDVEQKAAEKVLECIWDCLFENLKPYAPNSDPISSLPWSILRETESLKMTRYLSRACATWAKEGLITPTILTVIESHLLHKNKDCAWLLLALLSGHVPVRDPTFALKYFNESIHTPEGVGLYALLQVLRVLFASVSQLPPDQQVVLQKDLIQLVRRFSIPPELVSTAVDICAVVSSNQASIPGSTEVNFKLYFANIDAWAVEIIEVIDRDLTEKILKPTNVDEVVENKRMHCQVFTLGELAQICPHRINNRLFLLMQSIIFQQGRKHRKKKRDKEIGSIPSTQTQTTQPPECAFTPTTRLQALSIITLAKMCLQNEEMAKKIVPAFGRLLTTASGEEAVRNNIMYALSDMCIRYASLVDPLMPQITACLKDSSLVVRRTTLTTLIHLLQEDYLKVNGVLFFRILQTLSDDEEEIRHLTTFYIQQRLLKRDPKVMFNHFVEALFHFNECESHHIGKKYAAIDKKEKQLFSLKGPEHRNARMSIYKFMLEHMTDEHRIHSNYRLCIDILNGCVEGSIKLKDPGAFDLIQDTLSCLSCDEIKLNYLKSRGDETEEEPSDPSTGQAVYEEAATAAVKKTLLSQIVKKNLKEHIVPIIIALKHKLETSKSTLLNHLMNYLRELMKDYKNEVKEILSDDKTLANEIQFDLRKWEEQEQERRQREKELQDEALTQSPRPSGGEMLRTVLHSALANLRTKKSRQRSTNQERDEPNSDSEDGMKAVSKDFFQLFQLNPPDSQDGNTLTEDTEGLTSVAEKMLSPRVTLKTLNLKEKRSRPHLPRRLENELSAMSSPVPEKEVDLSHFEEELSPLVSKSETLRFDFPQSTEMATVGHEGSQTFYVNNKNISLSATESGNCEVGPSSKSDSKGQSQNEFQSQNLDYYKKSPTNTQFEKETALHYKNKGEEIKISSTDDSSEKTAVGHYEVDGDQETVAGPSKDHHCQRIRSRSGSRSQDEIVAEPRRRQKECSQDSTIDNIEPTKQSSSEEKKRQRNKLSKVVEETETHENSLQQESQRSQRTRKLTQKMRESILMEERDTRVRRQKVDRKAGEGKDHERVTVSSQPENISTRVSRKRRDVALPEVIRQQKRGRNSNETSESSGTQFSVDSTQNEVYTAQESDMVNESLASSDVDVSLTVKVSTPPKKSKRIATSLLSTSSQSLMKDQDNKSLKLAKAIGRSEMGHPFLAARSSQEPLQTPQAPSTVKRNSQKRNLLRAISTPSRTELRENVTFLEKSQDLSAIPVLSPPSVRKRKTDLGGNQSASSSTSSSFKFRPSGKVNDPFDALIEKQKK